MKASVKPIKRSPQLAPLSREHHEALLFVWKIREGIKNGTSSNRIVEYCNWFWQNHMQDHFEKEEEGFSKILPPDNVMMAKMLDDHDAIKIKLSQLSQNSTEDDFKRLAQIISYHIRYEERQLFNYIEQIATSSQLEILAQDINDHPKKTAVCIDEFWMKKK